MRVKEIRINIDPDDVMTTTQAARYLGCSKRWIQYLCKRGRIPHAIGSMENPKNNCIIINRKVLEIYKRRMKAGNFNSVVQALYTPTLSDEKRLSRSRRGPLAS